MLESFLDSIFGWAVDISPLTGIIIISFILVFLTTLVYKFTTNQKMLEDLQTEMKGIKKEMKESRSFQL